ncbi:hypothetical protein EZJ49_10075 [Bdellovibrio bacteriovorus]|uniref:hypothetical protein n=1 Tax=Bdellovibrio bacteriovorus TaxID=959 RepID=UPI0021D3D088|nr:hypothetical protein [Bdellovibrio bacteriovorus]UXR63422.1 hypothetical protein EZJ49_10075 [Bdellovibrio bacteriovorus]
MKWKNTLKILSISLGLCLVVLTALGLWGLSRLPAAYQIKNALVPSAMTKAAEENSTTAETTTMSPGKMALQVLRDDFANTERPFSEGCKYLTKSSESTFLKDPNHATFRFFITTLYDNHDPLVETAAPVFRYIFRLPGMNEVVPAVLQSTENEQGLFQKALFYYHLYQAGNHLSRHPEKLDEILQKSYNLHHLVKAVSLKPELATDSETQTFCDELEKELNLQEPFDANKISERLTAFFANKNIDIKDLSYDPEYRSKTQIQLSGSKVGVQDTWVAKLFAKDIEEREKRKKNTH